jgi:hypothetical protein
MLIAFILSVLSTVLSVVNLSRISIRHHTPTDPKSVSERATLTKSDLILFRRTLLLTSTLFAVVVYGFIAPGAMHGLAIAAAWTLTYLGIVVAALLPARGKTIKLHLVAAQAMGLGMLLLVYFFWRSYSGLGSTLELVSGICMVVLAIGTYVDKKRYILHELGFIYLHNLTIVIAAIFLR